MASFTRGSDTGLQVCRASSLQSKPSFKGASLYINLPFLFNRINVGMFLITCLFE